MVDEAADPLLAVVAPPRLARFRELANLADDELITADFTGWSKRVLLTQDRAVPFPRDHTQVINLEREVEALRAIAHLGRRSPTFVDVSGLPTPRPVVSRAISPGASTRSGASYTRCAGPRACSSEPRSQVLARRRWLRCIVP